MNNYTEEEVVEIIKSVMFGTVCSFGDGHKFYEIRGIDTTERAKEKLNAYNDCKNKLTH